MLGKHAKIVSSCLLASLVSWSSAADDSTSPVVSAITAGDSFSSAGGSNLDDPVQTKTTGTVPISPGLSAVYVNGVKHEIGKGETTYITVQGAQAIRYNGDCEDRGNSCRVGSLPLSTGPCVITISDTKIVGCNTEKSYIPVACNNGHCGSSRTRFKIGTKGYIYSVVGEK